MAIPFALALALTVGSYLLLLFVYATLFSLATQCVKSAAPSLAFFDDLTMMTVTKSQPLATWIDRSIDFAINVAGLSNVNATRQRRWQWDPGITKQAHRSMATPPWIDLGADFRDDFALTTMASSGLALLVALTNTTTIATRARRVWTLAECQAQVEFGIEAGLVLRYCSIVIPSYYDRWYRCSSTVIRFYRVLPCPISSRHKRKFNIFRLHLPSSS